MNSFPFSIVCMIHVDSNITTKVFYSAFGAEILISARTNNDATIFERLDKSNDETRR